MKEDRFLLGILVAIALLAAAAVALFFRRGIPGYVEGDTPEAALQNYIIALEQRDYERAYTYLADESGKPDFGAFRQYLASGRLGDLSVGLVILASTTSGDKAFIDVEVVHSGQGLFDTGWRETSAAELAREEDGWKLRRMPFSFWGYDWYDDAPGVKLPVPPGG